MRAALAVVRLTPDIDHNLISIRNMIRIAAQRGANLVLFGEAVLTGLINRDDPVADLPLGVRLPGAVTEEVARTARKQQIVAGLGLLERDGGRLYDSAALFDSRGELLLRYRRVTPGWHGPHADRQIYGSGEAPAAVNTTLGRIALLLCGDLFSETALAVRDMNVDWLLLPYVRCSDDPSYDQQRWQGEEEPHYARRVGEIGVTTLMVSYLADSRICRGMCGECAGGAYGGAAVISGDGSIQARKAVGAEGLLIFDLPEEH